MPRKHTLVNSGEPPLDLQAHLGSRSQIMHRRNHSNAIGNVRQVSLPGAVYGLAPRARQ